MKNCSKKHPFGERFLMRCTDKPNSVPCIVMDTLHIHYDARRQSFIWDTRYRAPQAALLSNRRLRDESNGHGLALG